MQITYFMVKNTVAVFMYGSWWEYDWFHNALNIYFSRFWHIHTTSFTHTENMKNINESGIFTWPISQFEPGIRSITSKYLVHITSIGTPYWQVIMTAYYCDAEMVWKMWCQADNTGDHSSWQIWMKFSDSGFHVMPYCSPWNAQKQADCGRSNCRCFLCEFCTASCSTFFLYLCQFLSCCNWFLMYDSDG